MKVYIEYRHLCLVSLALCLLTIVAGASTVPTISTIFTEATHKPLTCVAADSSGNLYIAIEDVILDAGFSSTVVKVTPGGTVTTLAGGGFTATDGVAATATALEVDRLVLDSSGNLYIADAVDNAVRVVNMQAKAITVFGKTIAPGQIQTVAGTLGEFGTDSTHMNSPVGLALDSSGNLWIVDNSSGTLSKVTPAGVKTIVLGQTATGSAGDGGPGTAAHLKYPQSVILDLQGNVYIADQSAFSVRVYNSSSSTHVVFGVSIPAGYINTVVGKNGTACSGTCGDGGAATAAGLDGPVALALDPSGNLYVADGGNRTIRMVSAATNKISTIAGTAGVFKTAGDGGPASLATFDDISAIAFDQAGNLDILDVASVRQVAGLVVLQPSFPANGLVNAASFVTPVAPGGLASIFGSNLSGATVLDSALPLPALLNSVSVTVNGVAAPLLYVSSSQINFQIPRATPVATPVAVIVTNSGVASPTIQVTFAANAVGIFNVTHANGSLVTAASPATAGEVVVVSATGGGKVNNAPADGAVAPGSPNLATTQVTPTATIGNLSGGVQFSGLTPTYVGLLQVNVQLPSTLPSNSGTLPLTLTFASSSSQVYTLNVK